jgi:hypothetical protein
VGLIGAVCVDVGFGLPPGATLSFFLTILRATDGWDKHGAEQADPGITSRAKLTVLPVIDEVS